MDLPLGYRKLHKSKKPKEIIDGLLKDEGKLIVN
jgi:hypothetical protein